MIDDTAILPVSNGDWLVTTEGRQLFKVRSVYSMDGVIYMDLYEYDHNGVRLPRQSPHMGGPRTFEPAITFDADEFLRVGRPRFPLCNTPRRSPGPGLQQVKITYLPDLVVMPWREGLVKQRLVKTHQNRITDEDRTRILTDARIRALYAEADTLERVTLGAFVVMSTESIRERAADLRSEAAEMEKTIA